MSQDDHLPPATWPLSNYRTNRAFLFFFSLRFFFRRKYLFFTIIHCLFLLLLVRLGVYVMNLRSFFFYRLIGKLTAFLHLQEFSLRDLPVSTSTTSTRRSPHTSSPRSGRSSSRLQHYTLITLNIDVTPTVSKSHTHPSHSQTSRLLTSSLSLGVPVPCTPSVCEGCRSLSFNF
jgi:hypothetical protein